MSRNIMSLVREGSRHIAFRERRAQARLWFCRWMQGESRIEVVYRAVNAQSAQSTFLVYVQGVVLYMPFGFSTLTPFVFRTPCDFARYVVVLFLRETKQQVCLAA